MGSYVKVNSSGYVIFILVYYIWNIHTEKCTKWVCSSALLTSSTPVWLRPWTRNRTTERGQHPRPQTPPFPKAALLTFRKFLCFFPLQLPLPPAKFESLNAVVRFYPCFEFYVHSVNHGGCIFCVCFFGEIYQYCCIRLWLVHFHCSFLLLYSVLWNDRPQFIHPFILSIDICIISSVWFS